MTVKIVTDSTSYISEELIKKYDIDYIIIFKNTPLAKNIFNFQSYKLIYEDKYNYVIEVIK